MRAQLAEQASPAADPAVGLARSGARRLGVLLVLVVVLVVLCLASIAVGAKAIPLGDVVSALLDAGDPDNQVIVSGMRWNRTALGVVCGVALGLAGALMQALTRNPLADPGLLGVNAGAAFGVTLSVAVVGSMPLSGYLWFAMAGAAAASVVVYALASIGPGAAGPIRLALSGVAFAAVLTGITSALVILDADVLQVYRFWRVGSLAGREAETVGVIGPFVLVGVALALLLPRALNTMALGDDTATALGTNVAVTRGAGAVSIMVLCGVVTAAIGPIAFVGLVVPHIVRTLIGPDHRWVVPFCIVVAPILMLTADIVGRIVLTSGELPVGIVTTIIGGPVLVALVRRRRTVAS